MIDRFAYRRREPVAPPPEPPEPLELAACYGYCEALARARHHNFPVASLFAPAGLRRHIFALYAFARTADDIADEPELEGRRSRELDLWEARLQACYHGETPDHPVFFALANTIQEHDLPITPFSSLLAGFRMDLEVRRFATASDLTGYAELAAAPVGHLFLYLAGCRDPSLHRYAEQLAVGLALANFWQDIGRDLEQNRLYLPLEDLWHFDLREDDLLARRQTRAVGALMRYQVARTRALFERARPLVDQIGPDLALEIALIWLGGSRILDKIEGCGAGILSRRPQLNALDKAEVVARALAWRGGTLAQRFR